MTNCNVAFNAKNVTISTGSVRDIYVDCDNADIDDILSDIPNMDIAEYVNDNFNDIYPYLDTDTIISKLKTDGLIPNNIED